MEKKRYIWICESNDGYTENSIENGTAPFSTQEEAYNDMRNAVLKKMTWNTNYVDFGNAILNGSEEDTISYKVVFNPTTIVHTSYSGTYTYKIVERLPMPKTINISSDIFMEYDSIKQCHVFYRMVGETRIHVAFLYDNGYLHILDNFIFHDPQVTKFICKFLK